MTFLIDSAIRMSVVFGVALLAMVFLRKRSAAARHWVLSAAVLCAALMPVGTLLLPAWSLSPAASEALSVSALTQTFSGGMPSEATPVVTTPRSGLGWPAIAWFNGSIVSFLVLAIGYARLMRAVRRSEPVTSGSWLRIAECVSLRYGLKRRVRLVRSQSCTMLVTWGSLRPRILLPAGSEQWPDERISVVLQHEMAHVRRNDWLLHTVAELLRIVYWFNPLLWVVCRRLRLESEYAADDAVLAQGIPSSQYAAHLLEIVRTLQQPDRAWSAASAMARPSTIERRFSAMLSSTADRRPMSRIAMAAAAIVFLCASLPFAALSSSAPIPVVVPVVGVATLPIPKAPVPAVQQSVPSSASVAASREQQPQTPPGTAPKSQYKGELISLDLRNTDIKDFFRMMGDLSGLNVVVDSDVTGQISVVLKEMPWDQALDIVANNKQLGLVLQGNVLRVTSKPQSVREGRIVLDFEVFKSGKLMGRSRIATADKVVTVLQMMTNQLVAELSSNLADLEQQDARLKVLYSPEWPARRQILSQIETVQRQIREQRDQAFTIQVTPTQGGADQIDLDLRASIGEANFGGRFSVSKDMPGKINWEVGNDSFEIRVVWRPRRSRARQPSLS